MKRLPLVYRTVQALPQSRGSEELSLYPAVERWVRKQFFRLAGHYVGEQGALRLDGLSAYLVAQAAHEGPRWAVLIAARPGCEHQLNLPADLERSLWDLVSHYGDLEPFQWVGERLREQACNLCSRPEGEARPKGTDEVAPGDGKTEDSLLHGGDGNSGEVDHAAQTAAQMPREGAGGGSQSEDMAIEADAASSKTLPVQKMGDTHPSAAGLKPPGGEPGLSSETSSESQQPCSRTADPEGTALTSADTHLSLLEAAEDGSTTAAESDLPKGLFGGMTADREEARQQIATLRSEGRRLVKELRRLIRMSECGLQGHPSPRFVPHKLVREMLSSRWSLNKARREEMDLPVFAVMADLSGSCSATSTQTLAACYTIAAEMPDRVVVIEHSNGEVTDVVRGDVRTTMPLDKYGHRHPGTRLDEWYERNVHRPLGGVLFFGDWDGSHHLGRLAAQMTEESVIVWLDSHAKKSGVICRPALIQSWVKEYGLRCRVHYCTGVGDAETAVAALRMLH